MSRKPPGGSSLGVTPIRPRRSKALMGISGSGRVGGPHAVVSPPFGFSLIVGVE